MYIICLSIYLYVYNAQFYEKEEISFLVSIVRGRRTSMNCLKMIQSREPKFKVFLMVKRLSGVYLGKEDTYFVSKLGYPQIKLSVA